MEAQAQGNQQDLGNPRTRAMVRRKKVILDQSKINNITNNFYSDEWYTDQATVDTCLAILQPTSGSTVMCPFDSEESIFVKTLILQGFKVIFGIEDYLSNTHYEFDYLVTNPPFSIKDLVIEKTYEYGKKSVLILPLDSLGGVKRHELYRKYGYPDIYIPTRRISYYDKNWKKKTGSNFHSVIITFNHGKDIADVVWEKK
jgi:hypothetical protein